MAEHILEIKNLKGYYRGIFGVVRAVDGVSLIVDSGEVMGLAGESGCGKSTLAQLCSGSPNPLLHYESGEILVDGFDIYRIDPEVFRTEVKCQHMSYIPQASMDSLNPVKRIRDLILDVMIERTGQDLSKWEILESAADRLEKSGLGRRISHRLPHSINKTRDVIIDLVRERASQSLSRREILKMAGDHLEELGLDRWVIDRYPHELSGGMKQRAVIGISTLCHPKLLMIDEPTSALDVTTQRLVIKTLVDLKRSGIIESMVFISHDITVLGQLCDRCAVMYGGKVVEVGSMDGILNSPLHPYTTALISSVVSYNPERMGKGGLKSIPGTPPDLRDPPPACRFHPRCEYAMDICQTKEPPLEPVKNGSQVACWLYLRDTDGEHSGM